MAYFRSKHLSLLTPYIFPMPLIGLIFHFHCILFHLPPTLETEQFQQLRSFSLNYLSSGGHSWLEVLPNQHARLPLRISAAWWQSLNSHCFTVKCNKQAQFDDHGDDHLRRRGRGYARWIGVQFRLDSTCWRSTAPLSEHPSSLPPPPLSPSSSPSSTTVLLQFTAISTLHWFGHYQNHCVLLCISQLSCLRAVIHQKGLCHFN